MLFAIKPDGLIYTSGRDMSYFPRNIHSMVHSAETVLTWDKDRLLAIYNRNSEIPSTGFATQEEAVERVSALLTDFSLEAIPMKRDLKSAEQATENTATATETAETTERKGAAPRTPKNSIIRVKVTSNPKRPGSASHTRFAHYADGQTVEDFLKAGGTMGDINFDVGKGYIALEPGTAPAEPASQGEQAAAA